MRLLPRLVLFCGLAYLCAILVYQGKRLSAENAADPSQQLMVLGGAVLVAILAGLLVAATVLPMFGEGLAGLIYGGAETPAEDPLLLARESVADGEYLEAQSFYRQALAANPDDVEALGELADLQTQHLQESVAAAGLLVRALEKAWPVEEEAFLRCKLAEIYLTQPENLEKGRALLRDLATDGADTGGAARARLLLEG